MKTSGIRVKTVRCDNAKEQMTPLKDMCWANGVLVEYVAPYAPLQNGKVERQFPTDLKRANAMSDTVKLGPAHKMKLQKINTICIHNGKYFNPRWYANNTRTLC
jgi:hypothetical protein